LKKVNCKITDAEWLIMKVLWEESPLTTTKIIQVLSETINWSPKTIHSLISRLVKKEAIGINKESSQYRYYPLVDKADCVMEETRSFVQKVYDGSLKLMIANFIKDEKMSRNEIEELKRILDEKIK
jgi:BlaI family transcriptional regulator, penicillinase repressor